MNKSELVVKVKEILVGKFGETVKVTNKDAKEITETLFGAITDSLVKDGEVVIPGIGKVKIVDKAPRKGVIKRDGEEIPYDVPAGKRAKLEPSKSLKESINK